MIHIFIQFNTKGSNIFKLLLRKLKIKGNK